MTEKSLFSILILSFINDSFKLLALLTLRLCSVQALAYNDGVSNVFHLNAEVDGNLRGAIFLVFTRELTGA